MLQTMIFLLFILPCPPYTKEYSFKPSWKDKVKHCYPYRKVRRPKWFLPIIQWVFIQSATEESRFWWHKEHGTTCNEKVKNSQCCALLVLTLCYDGQIRKACSWKHALSGQRIDFNIVQIIQMRKLYESSTDI